jgi:hypothetical protein
MPSPPSCGYGKMPSKSMKRTIDNLLPALVLVRIGQELGTDSPATRALHDLLELLASVAGIFSR